MKKITGIFIAIIMIVSTFGYIKPIDVSAEVLDDYSKSQDFEKVNVPSNWGIVDEGTVELSKNHYKHGENSLLWNWKPGSKLRVDNPLNLKKSGTQKSGGMKIWIYNENPIDDKITFKFGLKSDLDDSNAHYKFDVNINFKGWRAIWIKFAQEGNNTDYNGDINAALERMEIDAPNKAGSLYFDIVEFVDKMPKSRSADYQMPKEGVEDIKTAFYWDMAYHYSKLTPSLPVETEITPAQIADFKKIEEKYKQWIFGKDLDLTKEPLRLRNEALNNFIKEGLEAYKKLNIVKHSDGRLTGEPLFSSRDPHLMKFGVDVSRAVLLPLVYDYKINMNEESKEKFFNTLDYMNDQGWAYGSGIGTMDHESNKHNGYFHAIYLMKDELKAVGKFERERNTFNWQTIFGKTFEEKDEEVTSDELRTKFMYNLLYVLLMDDSPEKVRYMKGMVNYYDNALKIAPGYSDAIKSDYSLYHHRGTYLSAYGVNGIHMASLIAYLVSDTDFDLSDTSIDNLKNSLLNARIYANKYNVPVGVSGRLPDLSGVIAQLVPAYAYMALASDPIDSEMASAFMRLWEPNSTYLKERVFPFADTYMVHYLNTMGGLQLAVKLSEGKYKAEKNPQGTWVYPYSALAINRQNDAMVSVKGYSQYVWDFESANKFNPQTCTGLKENVYGRYQSYGSMQINGSGDPQGTIESGYNLENGWDWNRWPGATTKHLALKDLIFLGDNGEHRRFSDQTFVGGTTLQNQYGVFGMKLHDIHYDESFRANKSVFFFGDKIICLGSDIKNTDSVNSTETTLFQSYMPESTKSFWYNSTEEITDETYSKQVTDNQSAWMIDPYNNGYYLPNAKDLMIERGEQSSRNSSDSLDTKGNYTTAWINHGTNPSAKGYEYAIKVGTTPEQMQTFASNPGYKVIQKDQNAHIVKNTDPSLNITGYAVMNEKSTIDYGYLQSVSVPCMVMTKEVNEDEIVLSMSDPDLRLPKFNRHKDIKKDSIRVPSEMKKVTLTLKGTWKLKKSSSEARVTSSNNSSTTIQYDCVDGKNIEVELIKYLESVTLKPIADAYVRNGKSYAGNNFGDATKLLRVQSGIKKKSNNKETFIKFNISNVSPNANSAKIKIYSTDVAEKSVPVSVYEATDDTWKEDGITYNNKPLLGEKLDTEIIDEAGKWYTFDITQFVNSKLNGDEELSLCFKADIDSDKPIVLGNKDKVKENSPQLNIDYLIEETYKVTFESNGGSVVTPITTESVLTIKEPIPPTKDGCTFEGWYKDDELTQTWEFGKDTVDADITLFAKWIKNSTPEIYVLSPTEDAHIRDGSHGDENHKDHALRIKGSKVENNNTETFIKFDMSTVSPNVSSANIKIYPTQVDGPVPVSIYSMTDDTWTEGKITYNTKPLGGTKLDTVIIDKPNTWYTFDVTQFVNSELNGDKILSLYFKDDTKAGKMIKFDNKDEKNSPHLIIDYLESETYTVTFETNGGSEVTPITTESILTIKEPTPPTKTGHTFVGWYSDADYINVWRFGTDTDDKDITLYAKWTQNPTYTVTYDGNENTEGSVPTDSNSYEQEVSVTVLGNTETLVKTGYTFIGWNTQKDGKGTDYAVDTTLAMGSANVILYAKWTANPTYTVTYVGNENTEGSVPTDSNSYEKGVSVTVLGNTETLAKTGYTFKGWNTQTDGKGIDYAVDATLVMGSANVTLYAKWTNDPTPVTYTVKFDSNGGSIVASVTTESALTINAPTPPTTKDGHTFEGWYKDDDNKWNFVSDKVTKNLTLYAKWGGSQTPEIYIITFDSNGGSAVATVTTESVSKINAPTPPTRRGYTFEGWTREGKEVQFPYLVSEDIKLVASWEPEYVPPYKPSTSKSSSRTKEKPPVVEKTKVKEDSVTGRIIVENVVKQEVNVIGDKTTLTVRKESIDKLIKETIKAEAKAVENGKRVNSIIEIKTELSKNTDATKVKKTVTKLTKKALSKIAKDTSADVKITTPIVEIVFDNKALASIAEKVKGANIEIEAVVSKTEELSQSIRNIVKNRPVFDFNIRSNGKKISTFGDGKATVRVPYPLHEGEKAESIVIYYVNDDGNIETITDCVFNENTEEVIFQTNHFSKYLVGYNPVEFDDINNHWGSKYIDFVTARGLFSGIGENEFNPEGTMTRAMFATVLGRMSGVDCSKYTELVFEDVSTDTYYAPYVVWAKEMGIVSGTSKTTFSPDDKVTREQMAKMTLCFTRAIGTELNAGEPTFIDNANISNYALEAVGAIQKAGIITGKGDNTFDPQGKATRVEASLVITKLIELLLK